MVKDFFKKNFKKNQFFLEEIRKYLSKKSTCHSVYIHNSIDDYAISTIS